jgi:hypothetical protein
VVLADRVRNTEFSDVAKNMSSDVRAIRHIAHVLGQHFFMAVLKNMARLNSDSWHCGNYRTLRRTATQYVNTMQITEVVDNPG